MPLIVTKHIGSTSASGGSGAYTEAEKLAIEMEMEFKTTSSSYYKELTYNVSGDLTNIGIWTNDSKTLKLFNKDFNYSGSNLDTIELTRISDNKKLIKDLSYSVSGDLTSISVSAG
jgi:hypothetical protein